MFCNKCGTYMDEGTLFCTECGAQVEQETPAVPVKPAKKKSVKKKILAVTAIVVALALIVGAGAFFLLRGESIYLCTSEICYDKDGKEVFRIEYTYNEQGSLLCSEEIRPDTDGDMIYNEEMQIYEAFYTPNGGKRVTKTEYVYNDEGHCVSDTYSYKIYDKDGNPTKLDSHTEYGTKGQDYSYRYNDDGTIKAVDYCGLTLDGSSTGEHMGQLRYHYDDEGRLVEISNENERNDTESYAYDYRYDDEGRLIAHAAHYMEGVVIYRYEYNEDGQLESAEVLRNHGQAPLDDDCITDSYAGVPLTEHELQYETRFEYDSQGRLVSRKLYDEKGELLSTTECEYKGKELSRVTYDDMTIIYTEDEADATDVEEDTVVMVRDRRGNVVKAVDEDGGYIEYEYQKFKLSEEDARQCRSILYCADRVDVTGRKQYNESYGGAKGFVSCVQFPTTELYQTDVLVMKYY